MLNWGPFDQKNVSEKNSHNAEKTERGTLSDFLTSIVAKHLNIEKGPLENVLEKKVSQCQKSQSGDLLVSQGIACYARKKGKTFLVQFPGSTGIIQEKRRLKIGVT